MSNINAAIGYSQIKNLKKIIKKKFNIFQKYKSIFKKYKMLKFYNLLVKNLTIG